MGSNEKKNNNALGEKFPGNDAASKEQTVITADSLIGNDITKIPMLVDPIFQRTGVVTLAGSSDTGKSSLLRQLSMDIVTGKDEFLGYKIESNHKSVIYVSTEDDIYALSVLLKKQNVDKIPKEKYTGLRFILDTNNLTKKLYKELNRAPADCIIIDSFSDIFNADLNMTSTVRNFLHRYAKIANEFNCLVIFLHHTNKKAETLRPSKNNLLGSQGFEAKMRTVVELRRDKDDNSLRHLCIVKGNYIPDDMKETSQELSFDENLTFTNNGNGVDFDDLVTNEEEDVKRKKVAKKLANKLRIENNMTIEEITAKLKERGYNYSRATVGNWLRGIGKKSIHPKSIGDKIDRKDNCPAIMESSTPKENLDTYVGKTLIFKKTDKKYKLKKIKDSYIAVRKNMRGLESYCVVKIESVQDLKKQFKIIN